VTAPLSRNRFHEPIMKHLHADVPRLLSEQTVGEALQWLRQHPPAGRIIYFYVVDEQGRLEGVMPTRRLILSPETTRLADIMVRQVVAIPAAATLLEACEFFIQHRHLALPVEREAKNPLNYLVGRVSQKGEGLAGHHAEFTMFVGDEASGLDNEAYQAAQGWAKYMLIIGNPNPTRNFFYRAVTAGDLLA